MLISINLLFHSQLSAAPFASVGSTYCYFHPLQLPLEQSNIRAKPNDVDFKSIQNPIVGCIWTPALLQEELLTEMFTVKPHTPLFQEQNLVNQERTFSGFAHVYSHAVLAMTTEWRQHAPWGWDDPLVCGERDDTDLDKEKSAVTTYSMSCTSPRCTVWAKWKSGCWSCLPVMKRMANRTLLPQSCPPTSRVQELVNRRFMPTFTNGRKTFQQLWRGKSSHSVTDWQGKQWHFLEEHNDPEFVSSWGVGEQCRTWIC